MFTVPSTVKPIQFSMDIVVFQSLCGHDTDFHMFEPELLMLKLSIRPRVIMIYNNSAGLQSIQT